MQFGPCPIAAAEGAILAHAVRTPEHRLKKGRVLSAHDIAGLKAAGIDEVIVARLEPGDVAEDIAAARIAAPCAGTQVRVAEAFTGRVNLYAEADGVAVVDAARVDALNAIDEAITLATVAPFVRVARGQMLATIKIIPFAAPEAAVNAAEALLAAGPLVRVAPFVPRRAALISTALADTKDAILDKNRDALSARLTALGSDIMFERRVPHAAEPLAEAIAEAHAAGADPILVFGASAITDRRDAIPAAVDLAGGTVTHFGMPVDPGNLLLTARIGEADVIGLPGCARSPKLNGIDFVLWRKLAGLPIGRREMVAMGVGGLLSEIPSRPQPREAASTAGLHAPRIAAIVLAAGRSSRMGSNKLLADVHGKPMVRHAVEAALASSATPVIVVTGNEADKVRAALDGMDVRFVENPDFSDGLSASLKCGINAVPENCDGALVMLGDMPGVQTVLIDRLIAAFSPEDDRHICVATRRGKRGNPVLWSRRFFTEIQAIQGDVGARNLIGENAELVCEVEAGDDAPLIDIDTPAALHAYLEGGA